MRGWTAAGVLVMAGVGLVGWFHPSRPLKLRHEDFVVETAGVRLAATLSAPRWKREALPLVVLVHGSGRGTRAEMVTEVRRWAELGFAVCTYDKRGTGESSGRFEEPSSRESRVLEELASHARAVFDEARRRRGVEVKRAGFAGVSQAGWLIPLAAGMGEAPGFAVILSGPAVSTSVEELYSRLTLDGRNPRALEEMEAIRAEVDGYSGPPGYDPAPALEKFRTPSLWLLGELDLSVPAWATVRELDALRRERSLPVTLVVFPGAGHDLRQRDGLPNPHVWPVIENFLRRWGFAK